jgi:hypothetical protein
MESYKVNFWYKEGDLWITMSIKYKSKNKGQQKQIKKLWEKDFKGQEVSLINIEYQ